MRQAEACSKNRNTGMTGVMLCGPIKQPLFARISCFLGNVLLLLVSHSVMSDSFRPLWTAAHQALSSVHGISTARVLEWVAISFSRGSSLPRDWETGGGRGLSGLQWVWCIGRGPHLQLRQEPQGTSDFKLRSQGPCRLGTGESGLVLG